MSDDSNRFRFLQLSNAHLDAPISVKQLPLSAVERAERSREMHETFLLALEVAKQESVDAVIIPGDLWHNETIAHSTITKILNGIQELGDIPVIISPGETDILTADSYYHDDVLHALGLQSWPPNVHIYKESDFATFPHPKRPDVSFTGCALKEDTSRMVVTLSPLSEQLPRDSGRWINILLLQAPLAEHSGHDMPWTHGKPFTIDELEAQHFTYAAVGHHVDVFEVRTDPGALLGACAGSLSGHSLDELGPRYAILGTIEAGEDGRNQFTVELLELDPRRMVMIGADITGLTAEDMEDEIALAIEDMGGRPTQDVVFVHLEGSYRPGSEPSQVAEHLRDRFYHLVLLDHTRPEYLSEHFDERTTESKFIASLLALKQKTDIARNTETTQTMSGSFTYLSSEAVEDALYYGLDALRQQRITVKDVD